MQRVARSMYRKIYGLPAIGLFLLVFIAFLASTAGQGTAAPKHPSPLSAVLIFTFLFWLVFGRRIAYHLVPLFISKLTCPGCGEEIDAVGVWNCACGFHDHQKRHLLAKPCPKCGKGVSHVDCPRCAATILLW